MQKAMTELPTSDLPFLVKQHLRKHGIHPETGPTGVKHMRAEVTLLRDTFGLVQVFFRSDTLLDLEKIQRQTGRKLEPLATADIDRIKAKLSLSTLPAFDDLVDAETLIDERLFQAKDFFVYSGNSDNLIRVRSGAELKHKDGTRVFDLSVELPKALPDIDDLGVFAHDRLEIDRAVTSFTALRIRQRLAETLEIPPLSATAQAIIRLRADPDSDITKLNRIVEKDPSLAAQVVSWASSSYYAAPGSIKSVQDAIVRVLGYDLVMNLALGLALGKTLEMPDDKPEGFSSYWTGAVFVAATCGALLAKIPREFRPGFGLVYLTGLLHNFGYLILAHAFRPHFSATCRMMESNRHLPHQHIEQHLLGITGDQIAAALLHYWKMPTEVCLGIRYQIEPHYQGAHADHAQLVYLANHLLQQHGLLPGAMQEFDPAIYDYLHLNPQDAEDAIHEISEARDQLAMIVQGLES